MLNVGVEVRLGVDIDPVASKLSHGSIVLTDQSTLKADLVVGADGEHSMCREVIAGHADSPRPIGRVTNRILIDVSRLYDEPDLYGLVKEPNTHCWMGPNSQVVCYSLKGVVNLVLNHGATDEKSTFGPQAADRSKLRTLFQGWDPRVMKLIDCAHSFSKWMLFETGQLESWVHDSGKLVLRR